MADKSFPSKSRLAGIQSPPPFLVNHLTALLVEFLVSARTVSVCGDLLQHIGTLSKVIADGIPHLSR